MNNVDFYHNKKKGTNIYLIFVHIILMVFAACCLLPLILIISISLTEEKQIFLSGYSFIPQKISALAYKYVFFDPRSILHSYAVTAFVTLAGTLLGILLVTSLAYVISRKDYRYSRITTFYIFFTMLFNGGLVPWYILIGKWLGLNNTIFALFVPYLVNAWYVLLMKGFMQNMPLSIVESAKIDGAGELLIFLRIVIPISMPGIATVSLFYLVMYWNDWWLSLLFIENSKLVTLQYLLYKIMNNLDYLNTVTNPAVVSIVKQKLPSLSARMAMCLIVAGPVLMVFPFFQKYFVKGITVGSLKG